MIQITIRMKPIPEKRKELVQTLQELTEAMRQGKGFIDARIHLNDNHHNLVRFIEQWETQEDVNAYLESSRYYVVLRGALKLLTSSSEIEFTPEGGQTDASTQH